MIDFAYIPATKKLQRSKNSDQPNSNHHQNRPGNPPKTRRVHLKPDPAKVVEHERGEHAHRHDDPQKGRRADGGGGVELGQDQQDAQEAAEPRPPGHLPELLTGGHFEFSEREAAREQGGGADEQRQEGRRHRQAERLRERRVLSRLDRVGETGEDRQSVEGPHSPSSGGAALKFRRCDIGAGPFARGGGGGLSCRGIGLGPFLPPSFRGAAGEPGIHPTRHPKPRLTGGFRVPLRGPGMTAEGDSGGGEPKAVIPPATGAAAMAPRQSRAAVRRVEARGRGRFWPNGAGEGG